MTWREPQMKDPLTRPETGYPPFSGTLIIRLQIKDAMVDRVLIDNRSEVNIFFRGQLYKLASWMKSIQEGPLSKPLMEKLDDLHREIESLLKKIKTLVSVFK